MARATADNSPDTDAPSFATLLSDTRNRLIVQILGSSRDGVMTTSELIATVVRNISFYDRDVSRDAATLRTDCLPDLEAAGVVRRFTSDYGEPMVRAGTHMDAAFDMVMSLPETDGPVA